MLLSPDGAVVAETGRGIGWATNNVAEYEGLLEGLRMALRSGVDRLEVYMDSKLVVEQMRGNFKVKHPALKPLHELARQLAAEFDQISFKAVPRAQNAYADRLTNQGIDEWLDANPEFVPPPRAQQELF